MSEQFLHTFYVCPVVKQGGGKRMAQHMGRTFLQVAHQCKTVTHELAHFAVVHATPFCVGKECAAPGLPRFGIALFHVLLQRSSEFFAERDYALLVPLSRHLYLSIDEIDILVVHRHEFRCAYARLIECY